MIPFKVSAASHAANFSPSITTENGTYRMRAPYAKPFGKALFSRSPRQIQRIERSSVVSNIAWLIVLLALASITCFGMAYYLFVTRWDARTLTERPSADKPSQVDLVDFYKEEGIQVEGRPDENFLTYLPHSGFHNQRIAFENALVLARLLHRTLLVPPIRLGVKPLHYLNFDALHHNLVLSDKTGLRHCSRIPSHVSFPSECADYFEYTHISWDWLMNLTEVRNQQRLRQQWNLTDTWIREYLKISEVDILTIKDDSLYQYRFLDTLTDTSPPGHKFTRNVYVPSLALSSKRLVQIGTLFGSSRLRFKNKTNTSVRGIVRESMSFFNPMLVEAADLIAESMGHPYLGVHLRLGDGQFKKNQKTNSRVIWWSIMRVLNYTVEEVVHLERTFLEEPLLVEPQISTKYEDMRSNLSLAPAWRPLSPRLHCKGLLHTDPHLVRLNIPLFISTDTKDPNNKPMLFLFRKTFPCLFYSSDFSIALAPLMRLRNADDGLMLGPFLLPFLDAMVLARAEMVVGTKGSTFSRFVEDVLWRRYHGMEIVQRG